MGGCGVLGFTGVYGREGVQGGTVATSGYWWILWGIIGQQGYSRVLRVLWVNKWYYPALGGTGGY